MTDNKRTVSAYMAAYNRLDHPAILDCLTPDVEWILPGAFHLRGREAVDGEIEHHEFSGPPEISVARMTEENDVVIAEGTVRTHHRDGTPVDLVFCDVFEMQNGKIRRLTSYLMTVTDSSPAAG